MTAARTPMSVTVHAQAERVRDADARLRGTIASTQARIRGMRRPGGNPLWRIGALLGGWLLLQQRRRLAPPAVHARRDRFSTLLGVALPALAPLIGVRVAGVLSALVTATEHAAEREPDAAARVDLDLFAGTWYEIARFPERHERTCADDVTATYERQGRGLRVVNRCRRANGRMDAAIGVARVVDRRSRAKLKVTFAPPLLRWIPFLWAPFWILDVTPDYTRALVGSPNRRYLWVLARDASIGESEFRALRLVAAAQGYDTQRLRFTTARSVHPGL